MDVVIQIRTKGGRFICSPDTTVVPARGDYVALQGDTVDQRQVLWVVHAFDRDDSPSPQHNVLIYVDGI